MTFAEEYAKACADVTAELQRTLASIDPEFAAEGTEVKVVWGNPGQRQKVIRARVARFPYMDINRNEKVDVSAIPSGIKA